MLKKANQILNTIIGAFVGVFIGHGIYKIWDFKSHPDLYAMQSAPWYTSILLWGIVTVIIVTVAVIIKRIIRKKIRWYIQLNTQKQTVDTHPPVQASGLFYTHFQKREAMKMAKPPPLNSSEPKRKEPRHSLHFEQHRLRLLENRKQHCGKGERSRK